MLEQTIPLLLSVTAYVKESAGLDLGAGACSDLSGSELRLLVSKLPSKRKITQEQQEVLLRLLVTM